MQVQLHTHSYYSFLEGAVSPEGLVQAAVKGGMQALALTDHRWLSGAVEFYDACLQSGIQTNPRARYRYQPARVAVLALPGRVFWQAHTAGGK